MVKNTVGGNKSKGQARKHLSSNSNKALKVSEDECEVYAQVTKMLGNGMCYVMCMDEKTRMCFIRGKFKGRGKRDNFIGLHSWVLVGLRDFETVKEGSQENCDLLEVYTDAEKEKLKATVHENWSLFSTHTQCFDSKKGGSGETDFDFIDEKKEEYMNLMDDEFNSSSSSSISNKIVFDIGEDIDIDDI
jgi:initiation factor 1A